jgi:ribosomal protein S18 acetylase RimI-like enzyme
MSSDDTISILPVSTTEDLTTIKHLFSAYASSLPVDISYQNFSHELSSLPGNYSTSTGGALLLARSSPTNNVLGCVGIRALKPPTCCEMKRLYVCEPGRGLGVGKRLLMGAVKAARELGYKEVWLDTLPSMHAAIRMYRRLGFREIEPYYDTPVAGTIFLALSLD